MSITAKNSIKKKRRFSAEEIYFDNFSSKQNTKGLSDIPQITKFKRLQNDNKKDNKNARKSMQIERISKCEQQLSKIKRSTNNQTKIDNVEFQKLISKRKQKNRFNFKTVQLRSIQHRSLNSFVETKLWQNLRGSQAPQYQASPHQRRLSLQKESIQVSKMQKEIKQLNQKQVQEKLRNKLLRQLTLLTESQLAVQQKKYFRQQKTISTSEKYHRAIRKQQQKTDFFIRQNNEIKEKILSDQKSIFSLRSQRVVYSSIFKQLQKEIKLTQNQLKKTLITSIQHFTFMTAKRLQIQHIKYGQDFQHRSQMAMNSFAEYKNFFASIKRTESQVKFMQTNALTNGFQGLHDRINSCTAINYYTQSRKVIVLPRYKEHYQSSRKRIGAGREENFYEELVNHIKRLKQVLGLENGNEENISQRRSKSKEPSIHLELRKNIFSQRIDERKNKSLEGTQRPQRLVQRLKMMIDQVPLQNQTLLKQMTDIDTLIDKTKDQIELQKRKHQIFQNTDKNEFIRSSMVSQRHKTQYRSLVPPTEPCEQRNDSEELLKIKNLLGMDQSCLSQISLMNRLQQVQDCYIATRTTNLFDKPESSDIQNPTNPQTDRTDISLKFKKLQDENILFQQSSNQNQDSLKQEIVTRGPKTLNSLLKNIQVYESYQKAFERLDFQKQYETEKNRKKRTLVRREGMVSLGLLKKEAHEKNALLKRKSSNRKDF